MKLQESKFNVLMEYALNKHQLGGFYSGDTVIIKPKYKCSDTNRSVSTLEHPDLINVGQSFKDQLQAFITDKTPLRVSIVKSNRQDIPGRPSNSGHVDYVDVFQETAPGLLFNVMTLPACVLEVQDHGINLPPAAGLRRDSKSQKAKELENTNTLGNQPKDNSTPKKNTKLANANSWPNEPGGRKAQKY